MTENNPALSQYLNNIIQRVDWLVTACSGSVLARESAKEHLIAGLREVLTEVYNMGFVAGDKNADYIYDQKLRVMKYKTKEKVEKEVKTDRKEILEMVLKEYGLLDDKINKKLRKKVADENEVEENI